MRTRNYIIGLTSLLLCAACNNEVLTQQTTRTDEIQFGATIQTTNAVSARGIGSNKGETEALPYIYGIHIRKMETPAPVSNNQYEVMNGNKGTLVLPNTATDQALTWTAAEKTDNTKITFFAWTQPEGVNLDANGENVTTGTIDFGDTAGNRAPKGTGESNLHKMNDAYYTPLELFVSAMAQGSYKDNPSISLPFTHPVAKIRMEVYNWDNEPISGLIKIQFPFINQTYVIEQKDEKAFAVIGPTSTVMALELDFTKLHASGNERFFYLPPIDFSKAGDFIIEYKNEKYYGTLNALSIKKLDAGDYMACRIDLNKNYGTGVGATIQDWKYAPESEAPANPYQGIYTVDELKVLKEYLESSAPDKQLSESLYISEGGKKIIRLYNDLTLADEDWSLKLENDMIFDGLGHIVTVPTGKRLFGDLTSTAGGAIKINNIRLASAGQLAASTGTGVTVYNCHANGTGHLVGEAKNGTTFDFCSAETATTMLAGTTSGTITVQNCFVAYNGATAFAGSGGAFTVKNSFIFNTVPASTKGTYYDYNGSSTTDNISVDASTGKLVVTTNAGTTPPTTKKLIDLLNGPTSTGTSSNHWVYVYGKDYPVMRIK